MLNTFLIFSLMGQLISLPVVASCVATDIVSWNSKWHDYSCIFSIAVVIGVHHVISFLAIHVASASHINWWHLPPSLCCPGWDPVSCATFLSGFFNLILYQPKVIFFGDSINFSYIIVSTFLIRCLLLKKVAWWKLG